MRFRLVVAGLLALLSSHAFAYDATKAARYPSPDLYRPNVDRLTINGSGSTGDVSGTSATPAGSGVSVTLDNLFAALRPQAATNAALKTSGTWFSAIRRNGFATPGDGGGMDYTWSPTNCTAPDDGAQVQPTDAKTGLPRTGCWIADFPGREADVRVWGAQAGQNVDDALDKAVAYANVSHKPLILPLVMGNPYLLARQHAFGNGTITTGSNYQDLELTVPNWHVEAGCCANPPVTNAFKWVGPANTYPFVLNGPAGGLKLRGVTVDCNLICPGGFQVSSVSNTVLEYLSVQNWTGGYAYDFTSRQTTSFNSTEGSRFINLFATLPGPNASGIRVGDTACTSNCVSAVIFDIFENPTINYDSANDGTCGLTLGMATQLTFINTRITQDPVSGGTKGKALCIKPSPGTNQFPTDITFLHPVFIGAIDPGPNAAAWTPVAGGLNFMSWSLNSGPFPTATTYGNFFGTDGTGAVFPGPANWTPTDASGAGLALSVQSATYTKRGKDCVVNLALTYPTTSDTKSAAIGGFPCTTEFGGVSRYGAVPFFNNTGIALGLLMADSGNQAFAYNSSGGAVGNSALSGKALRMTFSYRTN